MQWNEATFETLPKAGYSKGKNISTGQHTCKVWEIPARLKAGKQEENMHNKRRNKLEECVL